MNTLKCVTNFVEKEFSSLKKENKEIIAKAIIGCITNFVEREFPSLRKKDKESKIKETLYGLEDCELIGERVFVVARFTDGTKAIINENGGFCDFDRTLLLKR